MLEFEREIALEIFDEGNERSQEDIFKQEEHVVEKSDTTALGVALPEMLVREGVRMNIPQKLGGFLKAQASAFGNQDDDLAMERTIAKS